MSVPNTKPKPKPCPVCKQPSLLPHCRTSPTCNWFKCVNSACDAVLDFRAKRGHCAADKGRRNVTFLPSGEVA